MLTPIKKNKDLKKLASMLGGLGLDIFFNNYYFFSIDHVKFLYHISMHEFHVRTGSIHLQASDKSQEFKYWIITFFF